MGSLIPCVWVWSDSSYQWWLRPDVKRGYLYSIEGPDGTGAIVLAEDADPNKRGFLRVCRVPASCVLVPRTRIPLHGKTPPAPTEELKYVASDQPNLTTADHACAGKWK